MKPDWQPIETAPKDREIIGTDGEEIFMFEWNSLDWAYSYDGGVVVIHPSPTHWMPLPELPQGRPDLLEEMYAAFKEIDTLLHQGIPGALTASKIAKSKVKLLKGIFG